MQGRQCPIHNGTLDQLCGRNCRFSSFESSRNTQVTFVEKPQLRVPL